MTTNTKTAAAAAPDKALDLARAAREALVDTKGHSVLLLDVRRMSSITDYVLIVSGSAAPHLKALAHAIEVRLKAEGSLCHRQSGKPDDGWIAMDYFDVVIHVMSREMREYYALEELWEAAPRLA